MMNASKTSRSLLPANVKVIQRRVRECAANLVGGEFRIEGARGLVLNVMPSGTGTWYLHYDVVAGRSRSRRKHKIGRLDDVSLAGAVAVAERLRHDIRRGADPAADRRQVQKDLTFAELATLRFDSGDPLRPATARDYKHLLTSSILPEIGAMPARTVTREHVVAVIERIAARGATRRADLARAVIRSLYSFGLDRGLVDHNPATGMRNRHDYRPRDVIAGPDDIRVRWAAIE